MRTHIISTPVLAILLGACGGGDGGPSDADFAEQDATAYCETLFGCSCEMYPYADAPSCIAERQAETVMAQEAARAAELSYDPSCAEQQIAGRSEPACKAITEVGNRDCTDTCSVYHGEVEAGAACTPVVANLGWSDCAQGLVCINGACADSCATAGGGEGDSCTSDPDCRADHRCDLMAQTCFRLPGLDQPCAEGNACAFGTYCNAVTVVCSALKGVGEACSADFQCASIDCTDDRCTDTVPFVCEL